MVVVYWKVPLPQIGPYNDNILFFIITSFLVTYDSGYMKIEFSKNGSVT